jgi:hypothetical protein
LRRHFNILRVHQGAAAAFITKDVQNKMSKVTRAPSTHLFSIKNAQRTLLLLDEFGIRCPTSLSLDMPKG